MPEKVRSWIEGQPGRQRQSIGQSRRVSPIPGKPEGKLIGPSSIFRDGLFRKKSVIGIRHACAFPSSLGGRRAISRHARKWTAAASRGRKLAGSAEYLDLAMAALDFILVPTAIMDMPPVTLSQPIATLAPSRASSVSSFAIAVAQRQNFSLKSWPFANGSDFPHFEFVAKAYT